MKVYIEMKEKAAPEIFEAEAQPTKQTHPKYDFVHGPFSTVDEKLKDTLTLWADYLAGKAKIKNFFQKF